MIFVTVGSSTIPFDRLLEAVESVAPDDEHLVVQHGASRIRPRGAECIEFVGYEEFTRLVREARVVVTHAGVGSIMTALGAGKNPVVVPRQPQYGEAVDDHQVRFARRAAMLGLVTSVEDVDDLPSAVRDGDSAYRLREVRRSPLEGALRSYLEECVGPAGVR